MLWRFKVAMVPCCRSGCSVARYMTNVAWSPSPHRRLLPRLGTADPAARVDARGAEAGPRRRVGGGHLHAAAAPLAPRADLRLAEPVRVPSYWGNDDCYHLPDPSTIDYIVLDRTQVGPAQQALFDGLIAAGGPFEVLFDVDDVLVAKRAETSPATAGDRQQILADRLDSARIAAPAC